MSEFKVSPTLKGYITASDVLTSEGTLHFRFDKSHFLNGGVIFVINDTEFLFSSYISNQSIFLQRNDVIANISLENTPENKKINIYCMWSYTRLTLVWQYGPNKEDQIKKMVQTEPSAPSNSLVKWARSQNLVSVLFYPNEESFRSKVHSCLLSIKDKINEAAGYSQFWNIRYDKNSIISREPKKETEVHPTIKCLLSDQSLLSSFEVIPEFKTGVGNLDFLIIGKTENGDTSKICIEFKNAHSDDLSHGLLVQLPKYMKSCQAEYGIYCVLFYKGEWYDKPSYRDSTALLVRLDKELDKMEEPIKRNIRTIVFDLSKPKSASKK